MFSLASSTIPPLAPRVSSVFSPSRFYLLPPLPSILSMALHSVRELSVGALPRGDWMILVVRIRVLPIFICSPSAKPGAHTICSVISIPLTERVSKMNQITALMKMSASLWRPAHTFSPAQTPHLLAPLFAKERLSQRVHSHVRDVRVTGSSWRKAVTDCSVTTNL